MTWGNILGIGFVIAIMSLAFYKMIKNKKQGKTRCSTCAFSNKNCESEKCESETK